MLQVAFTLMCDTVNDLSYVQKLENGLTEIHEIWYGHHAVGHYSKLIM
jgi:hypothetical protein